jgi:hypothetical protein
MHILRLFVICLLPAPLFAAGPTPAPETIPSILELLGSIVGEAGKKLDDLQLCVILIAVLCPVTLVLHLWHKKNGVTYAAMVMLTLLAGLAAFQTHGLRQQIKPGSEQRLLLPFGGSRDMTPFAITLSDVDTLKFGSEPKAGDPAQWMYNRTFGREALMNFVETGRTRARQLFPHDVETIMKVWPTTDELWTVGDQPEPAKAWAQLVQRLDVSLASVVTGRSAKLRAAISKWPIARLQITDIRSGKLLHDRYCPDKSEINLKASDGTAYRLKIETIFNGDRDLDEAEACQLSLSHLDH